MSSPWELPRQEEFSLYLHVPFCTVKCDYCDFFSLAGIAPARMEETVEATIEDLRSLLSQVAAPGARIPTIYIGGGTPSALPLRSLERLLRSVADLLPEPAAEWSVELNPESLTEGTLELLREVGVNRLSLGVQSLTEEGLRALGRAATAERTEKSVELVSRRWSGRWNADLIVGFQGDSPERVARDLELLVRAGARHLSVYALTVEPGTPLAKQVEAGRVSLPEDEALMELLRVAETALHDRGIERYEVSNYAIPGEESVHNLRYWRMSPYLGVGPAATSTLYLPGNPVTALRLEGVSSVERYLGDPASRYREEELSTGDLLLEHLLMGMRTREGLPLSRLQERFGIDSVAVEEALRGSDLLSGEPLALTVPRERWNLLNRAVLEAVERVEPLLRRPY